MPELRLVVLATQDKLGFGTNFGEALNSLFGEAAKPEAESKTETPKANPNAGPEAKPSPATAQTTQQLVNRAAQEFDEYQRLTAAGKLGDAGKKLEELRGTLEELKKATGKP